MKPPVIDCKSCGILTEHVLELTPELTHYGKIVCGSCGRFHHWQSKPDGDSTKYRRPSEHKDLVKKYSRGFCEMCLKPENEFRPGTVLHAHHVLEYQDNGSSQRDNIWILCTACHRIVHWSRTYYGHTAPA